MLKRFLMFLVLLGLSTWLGITIVRDPGYVLLVYRDWTVEMPLWCAGLLFVVTVFALHYCLRVLAWFRSLSARITAWRADRQRRRAGDQTTLGIIAWAEGQWLAAEKKLMKAARHEAHPLMNYFAAARAAQAQGAIDRRDRYLQKAQWAEPTAELAIGLTQVTLQIENHEWESAKEKLLYLNITHPKHPYVIELLQRVYQEMQDWVSLTTLLPSVQKAGYLSSEAFDELSVIAWCGILAEKNDLQALEAISRALPKRQRNAPLFVEKYAARLIALGEMATAERVLRRALSSAYHPQLMQIYGLCAATPGKQLQFAESCLQAHPHDAELLLALGRLSIADQLWGKARRYLEASLSIKPTLKTYQCLADLLITLGLADEAESVFQSGLQLALKDNALV